MKTTDLETAREWQSTAQKVYADALKWLEFLPSEDARMLARRARRQLLEAAAQVAKLEGRDDDPLQILALLEQVPGHRLSRLVNELQATAA